MTPDVSVIAAFIAGTLSVTSPCVLPLIPLYIAHLAGTTDRAEQQDMRERLMLNAFAYVLGFSTVFILVGIAFGAASSVVSAASVVSSNRFLLVRLGGLLLIVLGLHQIGLITIPFLARQRRFDLDLNRRGRVVSSFLVGVTFAAGWTPCATPILGAILTMAAGEASVSRAAFLLAVYSAGLALPFLAIAFFGASTQFMRSMTTHLKGITSFSGAIMTAMGLLMFLGIYQQFFTRIVAAAPWRPWEPSL